MNNAWSIDNIRIGRVPYTEMSYCYHAYILKIYVQTYYRILKNDECIVIHAQ